MGKLCVRGKMMSGEWRLRVVVGDIDQVLLYTQYSMRRSWVLT